MLDHTDPYWKQIDNRGPWGNAPAEPAKLPSISDDTGEYLPLADEAAPASEPPPATGLQLSFAEEVDIGPENGAFLDLLRQMTDGPRPAHVEGTFRREDLYADESPPDERHVWSRADHTLTPFGDAPPPGLARPASEAVPRGREWVWLAGVALVAAVAWVVWMVFANGG